MRKVLVFMVLVLSFAVLSVSALAAGSYYHVNDKIQMSDINVIDSKLVADANLVKAKGNYNALFNDGEATGHLKVKTEAVDGSQYKLFVKWSSHANGYGITVTQDDAYAIKFTANAKVKRNGQTTFQTVYVHYNKLSDTFVVRGNGFRIEAGLE